MTPQEAYKKAAHEGYSEELEDICCLTSDYAYYFAENIKGANIKKCQAACKNPSAAFLFLINIKNADINYCAKYLTNEWDRAHIIEYYKHFLEDLIKIPGWDKHITQEMIDEYKVKNILK